MTLGIMCHSLMAQLHCKGTLRRIRMHASSCLAVSVPHIASARGMCLHNFEVPSTLTHHPCPGDLRLTSPAEYEVPAAEVPLPRVGDSSAARAH